MTQSFRALITGLLLKTAATALDRAKAPESGVRTESLIPPSRPRSPVPSTRYIPTTRAISAAPWAILS